MQLQKPEASTIISAKVVFMTTNTSCCLINIFIENKCILLQSRRPRSNHREHLYCSKPNFKSHLKDHVLICLSDYVQHWLNTSRQGTPWAAFLHTCLQFPFFLIKGGMAGMSLCGVVVLISVLLLFILSAGSLWEMG